MWLTSNPGNPHQRALGQRGLRGREPVGHAGPREGNGETCHVFEAARGCPCGSIHLHKLYKSSVKLIGAFNCMVICIFSCD